MTDSRGVPADVVNSLTTEDIAELTADLTDDELTTSAAAVGIRSVPTDTLRRVIAVARLIDGQPTE